MEAELSQGISDANTLASATVELNEYLAKMYSSVNALRLSVLRSSDILITHDDLKVRLVV